MPDGNPFAAFFFRMAHRQLLFLAVVGAFTMLFTFYGYGLSWISFFIVAGTILLLGLYAGLIWFWKGVFGSMLDKGR